MQAEGAVAAMVAGGQLSPPVGAVATNLITGTAPLAAAAASYAVPIAAYGVGFGSNAITGKALYDEVAAIKNGQCVP
jgi:hypothetical protein